MEVQITDSVHLLYQARQPNMVNCIRAVPITSPPHDSACPFILALRQMSWRCSNIDEFSQELIRTYPSNLILTLNTVYSIGNTMLKIHQVRLQQHGNHKNFRCSKPGLRKAEELEIKLSTSTGSWKE